MEKLYTAGKYFFATAVLAFAVIQIVTGGFMKGLLPFPASLPGRTFWAYFLSGLFIVFSIAIMANMGAKRAAFSLGVVFLLLFIYPHVVLLFSNPSDGGEWAAAGEAIALFAGGFIVAGAIPDSTVSTSSFDVTAKRIAFISRYIFAMALVIFGILHIKYEAYIVTLIPAWVPLPVVWSWLVCFAFFATALSIFLSIKTRLATLLFGIMFLIWVLILHIPLVIANLHVEPQWTSLFVALAMCGISFLLMGRSSKTNPAA